MRLDKWKGLCIEDVMAYERCDHQCNDCKKLNDKYETQEDTEGNK